MQHLWRDLLALYRGRDLLWTMTRRELSSRYAGSAIGIVWAYLQPALMVGAYFLVFDIVFGMRLGEGAPTSRVGTYLVVGALPWLAFSETLSRGASSLVEAGGMLQKNALPPVLFVMRSVLAGWVVFVPLMIALTFAYLPISGVSSALFSIPLLLLLQGLIALIFAYVLAILTAAVRDTLQITGFVLSVGVYLSPILFPLSLFPLEWRWILYLNPMTALVLGYQSALLKGLWPDLSDWLVSLAWLIFLAVVLNTLIRRSRDELVDWL